MSDRRVLGPDPQAPTAEADSLNTEKLLLIGLGNPILGDDGVGWKVAEAIAAQQIAGLEIDFQAGGGLSLMERLVGYDRAILIDALDTGQVAKGTVRVFALETLLNPFWGHLGSAHETNLLTALEMGRRLGAHLPAQVLVVGIETPDVYDFSDTLSPALAAAVPAATAAALALI